MFTLNITLQLCLVFEFDSSTCLYNPFTTSKSGLKGQKYIMLINQASLTLID